MRIKPRFTLLVTLLLIFGCDLPHQPGPQPSEIVPTEFEKGMNILAVLRADYDSGSSFVSITRALTTEEIYSEEIIDFTPENVFTQVINEGSGVATEFMQSLDTNELNMFRNSSFSPEPGERYELEITAQGFPTLTGTTLIPQRPVWVEELTVLGTDELNFSLVHDSSAFEYKLYLYFPSGEILEKVVKPNGSSKIAVEWKFSSGLGQPLYVLLFALDENLTRYGNSPISFIPNTYHPDGSTVSGGYGCFGSVALTTYQLRYSRPSGRG